MSAAPSATVNNSKFIMNTKMKELQGENGVFVNQTIFPTRISRGRVHPSEQRRLSLKHAPLTSNQIIMIIMIPADFILKETTACPRD